MPFEQASGWMQAVARCNPVAWALLVLRQGLEQSTQWQPVFLDLGLLALLAVVCGFLATGAFRAYQRSL